MNEFEGDSVILRGDLSNQLLVPWGLEMLVDDLEGSNAGSYRGGSIEGEDPEACVDAKYRGSGGINPVSEVVEASRLWPYPGIGRGGGRSME